MRVEGGRLRERGGALREEERRRRRPVVARRGGDHRAHLGVCERVVGRREEVAEEDPAAERGGADLDEMQPLRLRQPARAAEPQHLATRGRAGPGQPAAAELDGAAEALDAAEPGKGARDRGLAEEDEGGWLAGSGRRECAPRAPLERGLRLVADPRQPEPHRPHRPRAVRNPLDRLRDGTVLRHGRPGKAAEDDGGTRGDAHDDEEGRAAAAAQPCSREPERVERCTEHAVSA